MRYCDKCDQPAEVRRPMDKPTIQSNTEAYCQTHRPADDSARPWVELPGQGVKS